MNVLFLTLNTFESLSVSNIYTDLLREFVKNGDTVYIVTPLEKKHNKKSYLIKEDNANILRLKTGNIFTTNLIEKGLSTLFIETKYKKGIEVFFKDVRFDLILYSTPPITFVGAVKYIKKRDKAFSYLLLKDIFPQNALDIGILSSKGLKGIIYKYFRRKEKQLYSISDRIGCMSKENVNYVINNNPEVVKSKVEVCPNVIEVFDKSISNELKNSIRDKYEIPKDKKVFVYGGNLGRPQGIDFLIRCIDSRKNDANSFFLIVGNGTDYSKLYDFYKNTNQSNFRLMKSIPKEDYDVLISSCDVGLIFLDYRFTIPNFPSRLLGYMQAKLPILACTDNNTDIGKVINEGNFGWWSTSDNIDNFGALVDSALKSDLIELGNNAFEYLKDNYSSEIGYSIIKKGCIK